MTDYKIVASDLDGTLLNDNTEISAENTRAIKELANKNIYFVPASGRSYSEMPDEIKLNKDIRYIIASNGAVVMDRLTGNNILTCIPKSISKEILDVLNSYETHITIRHNGNCIVDAKYQEEEHYKYYNLCEAHCRVIRDFAQYSKDFASYSYDADNIEVFSAFFHSYDDKLSCKKQLEKSGKVRVVEVSEYNLEIMNIDAGKGNAFISLANLVGVSCSQTISVGDSDNDSSIIRAAGLGLVVSNGCDSLKSIADEIICSNEEHAIEYILTHYFS